MCVLMQPHRGQCKLRCPLPTAGWSLDSKGRMSSSAFISCSYWPIYAGAGWIGTPHGRQVFSYLMSWKNCKAGSPDASSTILEEVDEITFDATFRDAVLCSPITASM